jgi:glycine dehydrogenase subunit 1
MDFIPITDDDIKQMLNVIGLNSISDLFQDIPEELQKQTNFQLIPSKGLSELELRRYFEKIHKENKSCSDFISFLGGGIYDHYIPEVVNTIISRSEFLTPYTPYQPEVSQGILQSIYEYQTLICNLTGMEVSNASLYDGATALAEAILMSARINKRKKVIVSKTFSPEYLKVIKTYIKNSDLNLVEVDFNNGVTDIEKLKQAILQNDISSVSIPYPNFFGQVEDIEEIAELTHKHGGLLIISVYPIILGMLKTPGELGADMVVGNGQALGNSMSFGGPTFGFFTTRKKYVRNMPGRVVGKTQDKDGIPGYVLTLQTREQHIRRERATSNICTNQALNALAGAVYLSCVGKKGLRELSELLMKNTSWFISELESVNGCHIRFDKKRIFNEFILNLPVPANDVINEFLNYGIFAGIDLSKLYDGFENDILIAVTEKRTEQDFNYFIEKLKSIIK